MKSKKNIIFWLLLIFLVLAILISYYFVSFYNKQTDKNDDHIINTTDNLIYVNNKYNYRLVLPAGWQAVSDYPDNNLEKKSFVSKAIQSETEDIELSDGMQITVFVQDATGQTLREYINSIYSEFGITHDKEFIVSGLPAVELGTDDLSKSISTYIQKDNLIYSIGTHYNGDNYLDLYRDIVANNFFINLQ